MSRLCPKCHYQRQPTDHNPEWQCPSCHVAYNKVVAPGDIAGTFRARGSYSPVSRKSSPIGKGVAMMAALVLAFFGYRHYSNVSSEPQVAAAQPEIILYGTESCGYCIQARKFFAHNGIEYQNMDVERSFEASTEFKRLGGRGVPLFVIDGEVVNGWREERMRDTLRPWLQ